jgi:hypothetical protein
MNQLPATLVTFENLAEVLNTCLKWLYNLTTEKAPKSEVVKLKLFEKIKECYA